MIAYGQVGSKVWKTAANLEAEVDKDTIAFLEFKVGQWQDSIPSELQLRPHEDNMLEGCDRTRNRLRVLLYLRANQMRLMIFRRALLSSKTVNENLLGAKKAVYIAKDTIHLLSKVNRTSDIYSSQQSSFNYFLVSALVVVLLAVCHATVQFNESCHDEFHLALELIRGFSAKSLISRRLWNTVKYLRTVGPKLGVVPSPEYHWESQNSLHQSASTQAYQPYFGDRTLFSTGLSPFLDHRYSSTVPFEQAFSNTSSFTLEGNQLSNELTSLFDAIESSYAQPPAQHYSENPEMFDTRTYELAGNLSRSLLGLF